MQKRVLLYNDNTKRDLLGLRLLEVELRKRGILTKICNPDNVKIVMNQFRPHGFIAARGDHWEAKAAAKFAKVFVVPGEGAQQTKATILSVFMGRSYYQLSSVEFITKSYLWSKRTEDWLLETGIFSKSALKVVGNTRLDIYKNLPAMKKLGSRKDSKFTIGIAFSAKSTTTYYGKPHFPKTYFNFHEDFNFPITAEGRHFEDVCWRDHAILRLMMRYLKRLLKETDYNFILRPSPFEDPKEFSFLEREFPGRIHVKSDQLLPEFLCEIDTLLTCWSTTGLEALILNKPVISIAGTMDQEHLFNHISKKASGFETYVPFYHYPESEEKLFEMITSAAQGKLSPSPRTQDEVHGLLESLYNWNPEESTSAVIAEDILNELSHCQEPKIEEIREKFPIRYNLPAFIAKPIYGLLTFSRYFFSGSFKNYRNFRKTKDPEVERLISFAS